MKKIVKIDPEKEYEIAKKLIELSSEKMLETNDLGALGSSVDNLITVARVLMEREARRHGPPKTPSNNMPKGRKKGESREDVNKLPSKKFLNLEIKEKIVGMDQVPTCKCCNRPMKPSGLFNTCEKLEVIPKQYYISRIKAVIFNCQSDCGAIQNSSPVPSIVPTSNYGDSFIIDVALSKYCDLIPIERYVQIAFRSGIGGELPAQSLIGLTHHLANFMEDIYQMIRAESLVAKVLHMDETPLKMLEGDDTHNWYLWGFFSKHSCYFEDHNTRSGNVAYEFLKHSSAETIMTDGYGGYPKSVQMVKNETGRFIMMANCNAHAYRYFEEASITWANEAKIFLKLFGDIYELERERVEKEEKLTESQSLEYRTKMIPCFEELKNECDKTLKNIMPKSSLEKAINYFLNLYDGLTLCTKDVKIPLDNNLAEREIRPTAVGKKVWYGHHSKRGAHTGAIMFSIVQSCKMNNLNPRDYYNWAVEQKLKGELMLTPYQYLLKLKRENSKSR